MKKQLLYLGLTIISFCAFSQVQSPATFLGYELGDRFTRHHQVVDYYQHVAEASPNVVLKKYGETNEKRLLYLAFIGTKENLNNLETIRTDNLKRAGIENGTPSTNVSIVWLSYNVHGNESVSTEASLATLYELVKPNSDKADWLKNTVVIIDPCINPDGRARYVRFYWEHGNTPYNPDPNSWEHHEDWPGGRANHYLFDLNRDWAWQTQVETQQRMVEFNKWLPHVHVDFHEQGVNSPYYFAPAAEPYHELISDWQREFQVQIGKNHARYFDENDWFFFTKQRFDLLYPSYGDTYPVYSGAIGMTYEQGGSGRAGLGIIKQEGDTLTLKDRIAHHYTTGLSTIEVTAKNSQQVLDEFSRFYSKPANSKYKSFVLKYDGNDDKFAALKSWLDAQGIRYGKGDNAKGLTGYNYRTKRSQSFTIGSNDLVVNINQPKSVLTAVLFEPKTKLTDSLTYDITAWAVPYAYGLDAYASTAVIPVKQAGTSSFTANNLTDAYGYIFKWNSLEDARFLGALLQKGIKTRYTTQPITVNQKTYDRGSIIISRRDNPTVSGLAKQMESMANEFSRTVQKIPSGFVENGPDLGSSDIRFLKAPKVALIGGDGTSSLDYGATWHYFEQNLEYPVTTISTEYLGSVDLSPYDVVVMPNGRYSDFTERQLTKLNDWVSAGGTLIAIQGALRKFVSEDGSLKTFNSDEEKDAFEQVDAAVKEELQLIPKSEEERYEIREYVAGAVFSVKLDNTHPLAYGYGSNYFSLKTSEDRYGYLPNNNVGVIASSDDHLSGFAGQYVLEKVGKSLVFGVADKGRGRIVYMVDNPLFRSFWQNGKLLIANAVFFVSN